MNLKNRVSYLGIFSLVASSVMPAARATEAAAPTSPVQRPPQFVALAFDGSLTLDFWKQSLAVAQQAGNKFTYFASGVYFLEYSKRDLYDNPTFGVGKSAIGFGGTSDAIIERVNYVNEAYREGHEIGSHMNGHFAGASKWSLDQWQSEFSQFNKLFFDVFNTNGITSGFIAPATADKPFLFGEDEVVGFRAPLLEFNPNMYDVLSQHKFRYDTSGTAPTNYWPERILKHGEQGEQGGRGGSGQWNFPLAMVRIAGTGKRTLSMDFNFYYGQSKGLPDPANSDLYEQQMYDTYINYFTSNYHGNRAPVSIGHHFAQWNQGAYWRAMQRFAMTVCRLPEVRCITYHELADFMDAQSPETIRAYQAGNFPKYQAPLIAAAKQAAQPLDVDMTLEFADGSKQLAAIVTGKDADEVLANATFTWTLDGAPLTSGLLIVDITPYLSRIRAGSLLGLSARIDGVEVLSATHAVQAGGADGKPVQISKTPQEARALLGDLPEAHQGE